MILPGSERTAESETQQIIPVFLVIRADMRLGGEFHQVGIAFEVL